VLLPNYLFARQPDRHHGVFASRSILILGYAGIVSLGQRRISASVPIPRRLSARYRLGEPISGLLAAWVMAGLVGYANELHHCAFPHLALIMLRLGFGLLLGD